MVGDACGLPIRPWACTGQAKFATACAGLESGQRGSDWVGGTVLKAVPVNVITKVYAAVRG